MLLGAGLLHGRRIWSYEQLILDTEIDVDREGDAAAGSRSDDVSLALEAIAEVGPAAST